MYVSTRWRAFHDAPLMLYVGFLMEHAGLVPYRDIFNVNAPGTLLVSQAAMKLVGTSEFGQRILDLSCLAAIQGCIFLYLRRWGALVGVAGACLFSVEYLSWGSVQSFQREYLCMLPLALGLVVAFRCPRWSLGARAFVVGLLHGGIATLKPLLFFAFPVVLAGLLFHESGPRGRQRLLAAALSAAGLAVAPVLCLQYLATNGALNAFWELASEYWPLYAQLRGNGTVRLDPFETARFFALSKALGGYLFIGITAIGMFVTLPALLREGRGDRVEGAVLLGIPVAFAAYSYASGKFWQYHNIPLYFVYSLIGGLAVRGVSSPRSVGTRVLRVAVVAFFFSIVLRTPDQARNVLTGRVAHDVPEISALLRDRLEPGDRVQPLDVVGGAGHAMLLSGAVLATPFLYDFHFYHHPNRPYIQRLRARMLKAMRSQRPRFVIETTKKRTWARRGPRTAPFPALEALIAEEYRPVYRGSHLTAYERK
jgi:hypothetical protein